MRSKLANKKRMLVRSPPASSGKKRSSWRLLAVTFHSLCCSDRTWPALGERNSAKSSQLRKQSAYLLWRSTLISRKAQAMKESSKRRVNVPKGVQSKVQHDR